VQFTVITRLAGLFVEGEFSAMPIVALADRTLFL
jgi:hypothetical protein